MDKQYADLKQYCLHWGADLFGVADISGEREGFVVSREVKNKFSRAVCVGVGLSSSVLEDIDAYPTKLYFHHYRTVNAFLDQLCLRVCRYLELSGYRALPVPASQIVDWEKQSAHLSHKRIAVLAGLGWIGRNNLLVNKQLGSRLRLATVLTDIPLPVGLPVTDNCGQCSCCLAHCPAGAIKENPAEFDHLKCFAQLKNFQKARLVEQYICGICLKHCRGNT